VQGTTNSSWKELKSKRRKKTKGEGLILVFQGKRGSKVLTGKREELKRKKGTVLVSLYQERAEEEQKKKTPRTLGWSSCPHGKRRGEKNRLTVPLGRVN